MFNTDFCQRTTKDYTFLEIIQERSFGIDDLMSRSFVGGQSDVPRRYFVNCGNPGGRMIFSIDNGPTEARIVAGEDMRGLVGMMVFLITHPRGLAMSGVTKGVSFTLPRHNGVMKKINVINGCPSTEAARPAFYQQGRPVRSFHRKPYKFFAAWTTSSVQESRSQRLSTSWRP
ncbi:hypothetical protein [Mesorhizobium comanense]|uniref:hypothetical protein n=1 Tax=Mesorhizobium comanense TaxID=2502215 RepID=UPI0010F568C6|nr:hypothetical protein [Mesorhizobium comanense]